MIGLAETFGWWKIKPMVAEWRAVKDGAMDQECLRKAFTVIALVILGKKASKS